MALKSSTFGVQRASHGVPQGLTGRKLVHGERLHTVDGAVFEGANFQPAKPQLEIRFVVLFNIVRHHLAVHVELITIAKGAGSRVSAWNTWVNC